MSADRVSLDYTVRESPRARRVNLRVSPADGLVVVVPVGFDLRGIPDLLEEHSEWIARAMARIGPISPRTAQAEKPKEIRLIAIDRTWRVEWSEETAVSSRVESSGAFGIRVSCVTRDGESWRDGLRRWLIERGREHLIPWTEEMASTLDVSLDRITIRCQKTRWGSYTSRPGRPGRVSLNAQLLFLPHRLARYVILHELCHAVHANHSAQFWRLMRTHEPESDSLRTELRTAWKHVPLWVSQL